MRIKTNNKSSVFTTALAPFNNQHALARITTVLLLGGARPDFCEHGEKEGLLKDKLHEISFHAAVQKVECCGCRCVAAQRHLNEDAAG